jgi:homospermidine synthase
MIVQVKSFDVLMEIKNKGIVPVQLKVEFWAKEKGKSCRRNYQEQDDEARAAKLERRRKDTGVAPAFN